MVIYSDLSLKNEHGDDKANTIENNGYLYINFRKIVSDLLK